MCHQTELTAGIGPLNSGTTVCNQGPPDVMVTPVALPPADTARVRRHPPVFSALNGLPVHPGDRGLQNNSVSLTVFHREIAQTVLPRTVAAVLVTSAPPCFRVNVWRYHRRSPAVCLSG